MSWQLLRRSKAVLVACMPHAVVSRAHGSKKFLIELFERKIVLI